MKRNSRKSTIPMKSIALYLPWGSLFREQTALALYEGRYDPATLEREKNREGEEFLNSVIIVHKAVIHFAERYAVLAESMAGEEKDETRAKELLRIAAALPQGSGLSCRVFL